VDEAWSGSRLIDQVAEDGQEVGHRLASARFAVLDSTDGDAHLPHLTRVAQQVGKPPAAQATRPPQPHDQGDRGLDVVIAEGGRGDAHPAARGRPGTASHVCADGGSSSCVQFQEIDEQDGLVALVAASTQAPRSAEHVTRRAASFAEQLLATLAALVDGVGHQRATSSQLGAQRGVVDAGQWGMAEPERLLTVSG
jgi:hypothetical protein